MSAKSARFPILNRPQITTGKASMNHEYWENRIKEYESMVDHLATQKNLTTSTVEKEKAALELMVINREISVIKEHLRGC